MSTNTASVLALEKAAVGMPATVRHRFYKNVDFWFCAVIGVLTFVTRVVNLGNYPRWFTDEGVYVSQAWAVKTLGSLAPYTYWYDHPPGGWIQLAGWFGLTGALERNGSSSILAGREFMVVVAMAAAILIYALARRLGVHGGYAFFAALLYILSPLAIAYSRYVLLDNMAIAWTLLAMYLTLNPKRKIASAIVAGLCMAVAVLTKETALLFVPAVVYIGYFHYRKTSNYVHAVIVSASIFVIAGLMYPLFAILKGELLPGPGHVSLLDGQVLFQLANRQGSGSILDPNSSARLLAEGAWLGLDKWLPYGGLLGLVPALFVHRLRGSAIALVVPVATLLRGGYLPYPFIIGMLPFMAILVAGVADAVWRLSWQRRSRAMFALLLSLSLVVPVGFAIGAGPSWSRTISHQFTDNPAASQQQALTWVERQLPRDATIITEGELWLDVVNRGYTNAQVLWIYKVDTDPAVRADYTKSGVGYLLLNSETIRSRASYPTVDDLLRHSEVIATFGEGANEIKMLKVV